MSNFPDLKQIERKAFLSTFQDGLWDIYMGSIVVGLAFYGYHPASGYSEINWIWFVVTFAVANSLFWLGKKYVTIPRMGQVRFGLMRRQKNKTLAIILGAIVLFQAFVVGFTTLGWLNPGVGQKLLGNYNSGLLAVAALSSLFVGPPMLFIAYMTDFPRGYYIAILFALAVFSMIYTNQPIYPAVIGGLILLSGLALFIRFMKKYPIPPMDEANG